MGIVRDRTAEIEHWVGLSSFEVDAAQLESTFGLSP